MAPISWAGVPGGALPGRAGGVRGSARRGRPAPAEGTGSGGEAKSEEAQ